MTTLTPPPKDRRFFPWGTANPTFYLSLLFLAAAVPVVVVALNEDPTVAIVAGLGAFMIGGAFGLVFGIPRYAASAAERTLQEDAPGSVVKYRGNTNLEQISDWLTKILVGLGLTQFATIADVVGSASENLGEALTGAPSSGATTLAAALFAATVIPGFIFFYLWTRVYLPKMLEKAEQS